MNILLVKRAMLKKAFWDPDLEEMEREDQEWEAQQKAILDAAKAQGIDINGDLTIEGSGNNWTVNGKPVRLQPTLQQKATEDLKVKARQATGNTGVGTSIPKPATTAPTTPATPAPTAPVTPKSTTQQPKSTTTQSGTFGPNKIKAVEGFRQL